MSWRDSLRSAARACLVSRALPWKKVRRGRTGSLPALGRLGSALATDAVDPADASASLRFTLFQVRA